MHLLCVFFQNDSSYNSFACLVLVKKDGMNEDYDSLLGIPFSFNNLNYKTNRNYNLSKILSTDLTSISNQNKINSNS